MNSFGNPGAEEQHPETRSTRLIPIVAGLIAVAATYVVASTGMGIWGIAVVGMISAIFVAACVFPRGTGGAGRLSVPLETSGDGPSIFQEIEERLTALDEANELFGASLNGADMFRLVASRIGEIFPLSTAALLVPGEGGATLKFVYCDGMNAEALRGFEVPATDGIAGKSFDSGNVEVANDLSLEKERLGPHRLKGFASAAAVPLVRDGEVFAVFQLYTEERIGSDDDSVRLLEAIRSHLTPIFNCSLAFARSLSSALTDTLTGLPNERAFYMVLENQLAESLRHRDERPLTILSIDIRDFGAVNSMLGHAAGDRMLEFAGARISEHLRKMDFLARTVNDEFSVILPTASEKVAFEIIERIRRGFIDQEFKISDDEGVSIALNIGWATFWKDGETADQLVRASQQRKRQAKCEVPAGVLRFPKEYVN